MTMNDTKIDALYCRVSTDMQKERGESIATQKSRLMEYAKKNSLNPVIYDDAGFSARDTNRPAMIRLLKDIQDGNVRTVVITKIDRITRSIQDLLSLINLFQERNVSFVSLGDSIDTTTPTGRFYLRFTGEIAQWEREMISDRVGEVMRHRAKNGKYNGGIVSHGYMIKNGKLCVNLDEAETIRMIYKKYLDLESLRGVTQWLNANNYRTRKGETWASSSIRRILSNPTYTGKVWYNKRISSKMTGKIGSRPKEEWIICDGQHEPIVDEKMFDRVQRILQRQYDKPRRKSSTFLLSGMIRCGHCGGALTGYTYHKSNERKYVYYRCHTHGSKGRSVCKGNTIRQEVIENLVIDKIVEMSKNDLFKIDFQKALQIFNQSVTSNVKPKQDEFSRLKQRRENVQRKTKKLLELLEDETIDKKTYQNRIKELETEDNLIGEQLRPLEQELQTTKVTIIDFDRVYKIIADFKTIWRKLDLLKRKDFLWSFVKEIVVYDAEVKITLYFLPSSFSADCYRMDMD